MVIATSAVTHSIDSMPCAIISALLQLERKVVHTRPAPDMPSLYLAGHTLRMLRELPKRVQARVLRNAIKAVTTNTERSHNKFNERPDIDDGEWTVSFKLVRRGAGGEAGGEQISLMCGRSLRPQPR